jgi:hypothetical protein
VRRLWLCASGAERLCALGAKGRRFCAAPQLHRYAPCMCALVIPLCACVSTSGNASDAAFCSRNVETWWTPLDSPPTEAPRLRRVLDDQYGPTKRAHEYWFVASDRRFLLCVRAKKHKWPDWITFTPEGGRWSVDVQSVVIDDSKS